MARSPKRFTPNISNLERMFMVAAGSYLLYRSLSGKKKNIAQGITGGTLLARGVSGYCPVYDMASKTAKNVSIQTTITVDKPVAEVYAFWRKLENLPQFMSHLEIVKQIDPSRSQWKAKALAGLVGLSWEAEILMDEPEKILSWHSLPGSSVSNAGKIVFRALGTNKTELDITLSYHAPFGKLGEKTAQLVNPVFERILQNDLQQFKTYIETGKTS